MYDNLILDSKNHYLPCEELPSVARVEQVVKEYQNKYGPLTNLWKYNLPNAWRLIYTIKRDEVVVLSIVLEWMDHKEYEQKFNY